MIALDGAALIAVLAAVAYLGYAAGRARGQREGARHEAGAFRRELLLDLQTRASIDPAYEPQFVELVRRLLGEPDGPAGLR